MGNLLHTRNDTVRRISKIQSHGLRVQYAGTDRCGDISACHEMQYERVPIDLFETLFKCYLDRKSIDEAQCDFDRNRILHTKVLPY